MAQERFTGKQQAFVIAYLGEARFNATEAARLAGYAHPHDQAPDVLKTPVVRARIAEALAAKTMSAEEVLAELTDVARADWREFVTVRTDRGGNPIDVRMDLSSKVRALELLAKAHRLFDDRPQFSGAVTVVVGQGIELPPISADRAGEAILTLPEGES